MSTKRVISPAVIEGNGDLKINVDDNIISQPLALIGIRSIGKSYEAGKMCEQLSEIGQPFIVIDPEGEYWTLKERYPVIVAAVGQPVGRPEGYKADLILTEENAGTLANRIAEKGYSLVLDLRNATMTELYGVLGNFLEALYYAEAKFARPLVVFMEEAHVLIPEIGRIRLPGVKKLQDKVIHWAWEISARGRHRGLGYVCVARRAAEVAKAVLSQCPTRFIFKLVDPADLGWLRESGFSDKEIDDIQQLPKGMAYVRGLEPKPIKVRSKERLCTHGGTTPIGKAVETPELEQAIADLSGVLEAAPRPEMPGIPPEQLESLEKEKQQLLTRIDELTSLHNEQVKELRTRVSDLNTSNMRLQAKIQDLEAEKAKVWGVELDARVTKLKEQVQDLIGALKVAEAIAEKSEAELEKIREVWGSWKDLLIITGDVMGLELIPRDVKELEERLKHAESELEQFKTTEKLKRESVKETLEDPGIRSWVNDAKRLLSDLRGRSGALPRVLKAAVRMDLEVDFLPEELQTGVTASTNLEYLKILGDKRLLWETRKLNRMAFRNRFKFWITENVRRIKPGAPDEAIDQLHEQLKTYVIGP